MCPIQPIRMLSLAVDPAFVIYYKSVEVARLRSMHHCLAATLGIAKN